MFGFSGDNVNEIFPLAVASIQKFGIENTSRNGPVLMFGAPVVTTYESPKDKVLFNPDRDANPYFHLFESMWMLYGGEDVKFVSFFNKRMSEYSDDGILIRGSAYGKRWRSWFGHDQLKNAVELLRKNRDSRRVVISQWDPATDPIVESKDVPCNVQCFVSITPDFRLNLTVTNRSNDMIYGCYGSNVVHFSFLQEYLAAHLGVRVGKYYQFSNNLHVYKENPVWNRVSSVKLSSTNPYGTGEVSSFSLNKELGADTTEPGKSYFSCFDADLKKFFDGWEPKSVLVGDFQTPWFRDVLVPLFNSYLAFKSKDLQKAAELANQCKASDWRKACLEWLERRGKKDDTPRGFSVL